MVFEELHALEGGAAGDELVGEFGLVFIASAAVDLLMGVLGFVWEKDEVSLRIE